jgi:hypothetical protein
MIMLGRIGALISLSVSIAIITLFFGIYSEAYDIDIEHSKVISFEKGISLTILPSGDGGCDFILEYGNERFNFKVSLLEDIEDVKKVTGWKGDYFFLRTLECTGNASKCSTDQVFMFRNNKFIHLGYFISWADEIGHIYKNGFFRDLYNKFEFNALTSHAAAPIFTVALKEKDGRFSVDLEQTWLENEKTYKENMLELTNAIKRKKEGMNSGSEIINPVFFNAVLAKYCRKDDQLTEMIKIAQSELSQREYGDLNEYLSQVVSGEEPGETPENIKRKYYRHLKDQSDRFREMLKDKTHQ